MVRNSNDWHGVAPVETPEHQEAREFACSRCLPSLVIGPVLLHALRRLASICLKEVIERQPR